MSLLHETDRYALRQNYGKEFHEKVKTRELLLAYLTPSQALTIQPVECIVTSNQSKIYNQHSKESVWMSGYRATVRHREGGEARRYAVFAGLVQLERNTWQDGKLEHIKADLAVVKSLGRPTQEHLADIGVNIDRESTFNTVEGPFPVFDLSMDQLQSERFVSEARGQLETGLKRVLVEGLPTSLIPTKQRNFRR